MVFNSVSDSLFNNLPSDGTSVSKEEYDRFLIELTIIYEFDFVELFSPVEIIEFLKEVHLSIKDKPHRKELSMYSRKGFKPSKKALTVGGFSDPLSITYVSWLMCIPGLSENKAIAIARAYPTLHSLMTSLADQKISEKERKKNLQEIEVQASVLGEKPKKIGKVLAERIFHYFMSVDPSVVIN